MSGSEWRKGSGEEWRCRQLHYLLTIEIIHIHPPVASPDQGSWERGRRLQRGVREMDVLGGDEEWRDKGSDGELTKGVVKQGWYIFCCVLPIPKRCSHIKNRCGLCL